MSTPEGQVPRDAAFWATYNAVQQDSARAWDRAQCAREGHELHWSSGGRSSGECSRCGMSAEDAAWDSGWAKLDSDRDRWVYVGPLDALHLDQKATKIRIVTHPDGTQETTAHLRHSPTGVEVTTTMPGDWNACRGKVMRGLMVAMAEQQEATAAARKGQQ